MEQLSISRKDGANYAYFELKGAFTSLTIETINEKLYEEAAKTNVVIELRGVDLMDEAALGVVMATHNDAIKSGKRLYLLAVSKEVDEQLARSGFKDEFFLINSVTEVH